MSPKTPPNYRPQPKKLGVLDDWQIERIEAGLAGAKAGRSIPADALYVAVAEKHGWNRTP
jgi:hypothetical protein